MALLGLNFWYMNLYNGSVEFSNTLAVMTSYLTYFAPFITMRLFADEKKNGTEVLLRTSPISMWQVVLGKYFAAATVFLFMNAVTVVCPVIMALFMNEGGVFPLSMTVGSYIGFILLGLAYLAVGTFASSVTESQTVAALVGVVLLLAITFLETIGYQIQGWIGQALIWVSLSSRYNDFASGLFSITSAIYYVSFTAVVLLITIINIERKRWN
jgi:ABC-2 type transport system permease protein